ncbi:MAG TPA: ISKra4 family transposase, partial [Chloroflexota bacterium]|nr:ISKra4 family transposase [Chloroflexota bacterium]
MRLAAWMPFARAAAELGWFCGAAVGADTARRLAEAAGAALVAHETAEAERLAAERPAPPDGPRVQQLSADGAMVPLVGGEWAEAKTVALGAVGAARDPGGAPVVRTTAVSRFSRLADAEAFGRLALVETHRRGVETAGTVVAVTDGSEWLQGFVDQHRPDAVRVLDFPHAVQHLNAAAQAAFGEASPAAVAWLDQQAAELRDGDPDRVLAALRALP